MTSLIIETTKEGEKKQKSIPYINPQATDSELIAFAQGLVDLTTQDYQNTTVVTKRELETESKTDYSVQLQTNRYNPTTGEQPIGYFGEDTNELNLNITPFQSTSNPTIYFRLKGLSQTEAPVLTITTSNSNFGIEHRSTNYGTQLNTQAGMRGLYLMDLNIVNANNIVAGDFFTVKVNVRGDDTYNPYKRTITFRFVEWTGGEG